MWTGWGMVNHAVFVTNLEEGADAFYVRALGRDPHYVVARVEITWAEIRPADRRRRRGPRSSGWPRPA